MAAGALGRKRASLQRVAAWSVDIRLLWLVMMRRGAFVCFVFFVVGPNRKLRTSRAGERRIRTPREVQRQWSGFSPLIVRRLRTRLNGTMHIHLKRDGTILALGRAPSGVTWHTLTLDHLQRELQSLKGQGVAVAYSRDDPEADPPKLVEMVFKIIIRFELPMQLLREPPVPIDAR